MLIHTAAMLAERREFFELLFTTPRSQVASMILRDGQESGDYGTEHPEADQTVVVLAGHCRLDIEGTVGTLSPGDFAFIPAGAKHRLVGLGEPPCRMLNVYGPAVYPA